MQFRLKHEESYSQDEILWKPEEFLALKDF